MSLIASYLDCGLLAAAAGLLFTPFHKAIFKERKNAES
jgi:hypothetical protein